jgi:hypothetical protein
MVMVGAFAHQLEIEKIATQRIPRTFETFIFPLSRWRKKLSHS